MTWGGGGGGGTNVGSPPFVGGGVGGGGTSPLACSADAPQDQMSKYSHVRRTPHNHHSADAEWTVVGGYASLPRESLLCLPQPLNGVGLSSGGRRRASHGDVGILFYEVFLHHEVVDDEVLSVGGVVAHIELEEALHLVVLMQRDLLETYVCANEASELLW